MCLHFQYANVLSLLAASCNLSLQCHVQIYGVEFEVTLPCCAFPLALTAPPPPLMHADCPPSPRAYPSCNSMSWDTGPKISLRGLPRPSRPSCWKRWASHHARTLVEFVVRGDLHRSSCRLISYTWQSKRPLEKNYLSARPLQSTFGTPCLTPT